MLLTAEVSFFLSNEIIGYYQGPPVMAPPQYAEPPPRRQPSFLEGWYVCTPAWPTLDLIRSFSRHEPS